MANGAVALPADVVDVPHGLPADAVDVPSGAQGNHPAADHLAAFWNGLKSAPILHPLDALKSTASSIAHPIDTFKQIESDNDRIQTGATEDWNKGNKVSGVIRSGLSMIPFIGPALDDSYQAMKAAEAKGDTAGMAQAAGKMVGLAGSAEVARRLPTAVGAAAEKLAPVASAAGDAVSKGIANLPELSSTLKDAVGIVSPRAAHVLSTVDKIRQGVAKLRGTQPPAPVSATPEAGAAVDKPIDGEQRMQMYSALKGPTSEAASAPVAAAPAPTPAAQAAPAPSPAQVSPQAPSSAPALSPPAPESGLKVPLKARRMAQNLLESIRQNPATSGNATLNDVVSAPAAPTAPPPPAETPQPSGPKANPYEAKARTEKANSLAQTLYFGGHGIKPDEAVMMNPNHWRDLAKAAGTTEPSLATQKQAIQQLQKLWDTDAIAQQLKASMETPPAN
jgi:hypothetical protein